jgi:hypothetical protein
MKSRAARTFPFLVTQWAAVKKVTDLFETVFYIHSLVFQLVRYIMAFQVKQMLEMSFLIALLQGQYVVIN